MSRQALVVFAVSAILLGLGVFAPSARLGECCVGAGALLVAVWARRQHVVERRTLRQ